MNIAQVKARTELVRIGLTETEALEMADIFAKTALLSDLEPNTRAIYVQRLAYYRAETAALLARVGRLLDVEQAALIRAVYEEKTRYGKVGYDAVATLAKGSPLWRDKTDDLAERHALLHKWSSILNDVFWLWNRGEK